jgi:uncharacterized repeat protein (TIGR01451 family)
MAWIGLLAACLFLATAAPAGAQVAAGYSEYYIPGDEPDMWTVFNSLDAAGTNTTMHAVISVTAWSDNTTIYYDHWENGYNFDPTNPAATADESYTLLKAGDVKVFESANIPTAPRGAATYYDGGDHIYVAGGTVTVSRASWIQAVGVGNQSAAWEIYPVKPQLTTYIVPFGENLGFSDFNRVYVLIQATADNTTFTVDYNGDGLPDLLNSNRNATKSVADGDLTTIALNKGQTFLLDRVSACTSGVTCTTAPGTLNSGVVIQGTSTLQVKFVAGNPGQTYCARGFSAFPRGFWTKDYYAPLDQPTGGAANTDYYLYNPNGSAITVSWETLAGNGSFSVPAGGTVSFRTAAGVSVPVDSGLYFKGSDTFWGVGVGNALGASYEWGFSLLPSTMLYTEHFLGWAPGSYPVDSSATNPGNKADDGVFLSVAQDNTRVFVDINNDGTADQTYTMNRLQTQFIYNPATDGTGGDLSRAHFWATGPFNMAYGENADSGATSSPAMDLGYVAIPGTDFVSLVLTVDKTVSPQVVATATGSVATFTITVDSQKYSVDSVNVTDYLPANWTYALGTDTAKITWPDKTIHTGSGADPTITGSGPYTLAWSSAQLGTTGTPGMATNQEITIVFTARTTAVLAAGTLSQNKVKAVGTRTVPTVGGTTQTFTATDSVFVASGDLLIAKTSNAPTPLYPGDQYTYTVTVTNPPAGVTQTGVSLYDAMPAGVSYVGGSGSVSCERALNVRDEFAAAAYTNNGPNNTSTWAGAWTETDSYGTGPSGTGAGAAGGYVWITGGQLQLRYLLSSVLDSFDNNDFAGNFGSANWNANWAESDNAGNGAGAGFIQVGTQRLNFNSINGNATGPGSTVSRAANLAGATAATLSVTFSKSAQLAAGDTVVLEASSTGLAGSFTTLQTFSGGTAANTYTYSLAPYISATTTIQLRITGGFGNQNTHRASFDNVGITFNGPASAVGSQIQRTVDLTGALAPQLNFSYASAGLVAGDTLVVEASASAAGPFTTLATFSGGTPSVAPPYDLTPYIASTTTIRLRVTGGFTAAGKTQNFDNVDVGWWGAVTFASGSAPDLLGSTTGCRIRPGNSLTLTFDAAVDDPLPSGLTSVTNTAAVTTTLFPVQLTASVTNLLSNPAVQSASVSGKIWLDASNYGTWDVGEPGLANLEVTLKDQFGAPVATALTDASGHYLFSGVSPGNGYYVQITSGLPSGLTETAPAGRTDNRTNAINLTAGQDYTGADLAYRATLGTVTFGDLVWSDANGNGVRDAGEVGIGGVAIALYLDRNADGFLTAADDPAVATTTSAADGSYLFTGQTPGSTYFVASATPAGYAPTTDVTDRFWAVTSGSAYLTADFGFSGTTYTIKDRVWKDANANGIFDGPDTGFAGVTVDLLDNSLNVIGTTITAADGTFTFSGVAGGGASYTVRVSDTGGLLASYYGTTGYAVALKRAENTLGASVDHTASSPYGSFGFAVSRSLGDTVFNDNGAGGGTIGNGVQDGAEPGIAGVVVSLYLDNGTTPGVLDGGDTLVGTVTTDANGQYLFSGLSNVAYLVSVPVPSGFTFTGPGADSDANAANGIQEAKTISGGASDLTLDFGFRATTPRSVSGTVWEDLNGDGVINGGEAGRFAGVTLDILSGTTVVATVTTDASGAYSALGLAPGSYTVRITDTGTVLAGYVATVPSGTDQTANLAGGNVVGLNYGFKEPVPTRVFLARFGAVRTGGGALVTWETASESGTAGYFLTRLEGGAEVPVNARMVPALIGSPGGGRYALLDAGASGQRLTYRLTEVRRKGDPLRYGPFSVTPALPPRGGNAASGRSGTLAPGATYAREARATRPSVAASAPAPAATGVGTRVRLAVGQGGLCRVRASQIAPLLGMSPARARTLIAAGQMSLTSRNRPVAYLPVDGGASLLFSAVVPDTVFTGEGVYWLAPGAGLLVQPAVRPRPSLAAPAGQSFAEELHVEQNAWADPGGATDPAADYWFWDYLSAGDPDLGRHAYTVTVPHPAPGAGAAALTVRLRGATDIVPGNPDYQDHHVLVRLNGNPAPVGEGTWHGLAPYALTCTFDRSLLLPGANTVELEAVLGESVPYSVVYLDAFDLAYARTYEAVDDALAFRGGANPRVTVAGFTSPAIRVFDLSTPLRPRLVRGVLVGGGAGAYTVTFRPEDPARPYVAVSDNGAGAAALSPWTTTGLGRGTNAADYLVITDDALLAAARSLASYRASQGLRTKVVTVRAIMDEFNSGFLDPAVIRSFLSWIRGAWAVAPRYVLLAGDGSYDYRDRQGFADCLVPPAMVPTPYGLFASDTWYADAAGSHVPSFALGRLPARTNAELQAAVDKIVAYEAAPTGPWEQATLFAADDPDAGGAFTADSNGLIALLPAEYQPPKASTDYLAEHGLGTARGLLLGGVSAGVSLVSYVGHAGFGQLADEGLLLTEDVTGMTNGPRLPLFTLFSCLAGSFSEPGALNIGEALVLQPGGGAAAVLAPTGLAIDDASVRLAREFLALRYPAGGRLGDLWLDAATAYGAAYGGDTTLDIYGILGDPALVLR